MKDKPYLASGHDVKLDSAYNKWLDELGERYQHAQMRATVKVNAERLLWNWQTGRDLVIRKAEEKWGGGVVEQLSLDLKARFPGEKGFSALNLWFMKKWYLFYSEKLYQAGKELDNGMTFPELFACVPWRHHVEIISKCKTLEEAYFYIQKTIEGGWSRNTLLNCLKADLYSTQGKALANFNNTLPLIQANLAQEITKENYDFGFVSVPQNYQEKELEDALCEQMTRFLLELGTGFAFIGRQKELIVSGRSRRIDLLFYHIHLRCYIVLELKVTAFMPEYVGKLNFYVSAVDDILKTENDNPTIGLLICSDMNTTDVQYAFRGINSPIGVATYSDVQIEAIKKQLPSVEMLQARIRLLEEQLKKK